MADLLTPLRLGSVDIPNRIIMAPLTRCRAVGEGRIPNDLMATYYTQRASAGLIVTEATSVEPMGVGYPNTPGIWSKEQTEGWKKVTKSVHKAGGRIFLQLWHVGRISHPVYLNGQQPVSSSDVAAQGHVSLLRPKEGYPAPRPLNIDEIKTVAESYRKGAENALKAGFDGVEIHGANGYLIDQFLQRSANQRSDDYGGSIENRARFMLEVADAVCSVWGADRVGMHLAPRGDAHSMGDPDLEGLFTYVASELGKRKLAFLFTREHIANDSLNSKIKAAFKGPLIANEMLKKEHAEDLISSGIADAAGFGRLYISNPDLVERFKHNTDLNRYDSKTFYTDGAEGYTDYPFLQKQKTI